MTFNGQICDNAFDTPGRNDRSRHAYRVHLWQRTLRLVYRSPPAVEATIDADLWAAIKHPFPSSDRPNDLDVERALRM
jgi:hypothetical protein